MMGISTGIFMTILPIVHTVMDPEQFMCPMTLINYHGYPVERHEAITRDGYILSLFRIPHGRNVSSTGKRPVVVIQHGLLTSCWDSISNLPEKALAFVLADAGIDVWLSNSRGSYYSPQHVFLKANDPPYWRFSWDEMARYDIPAVIDTVLNKTGVDQLYYVGHSQGTLILFAGASINETLARKVKYFFAMAPLITKQYSKGSIMKVVMMFRKEIEFLFSYVSDLISIVPIIFPVCGHQSIFFNACSLFMNNIAGDSTKLNETRLPVFTAAFPAGTSKQNMIHWGQMNEETGTRMFDHGKSGNLKRYGTEEPPAYNFSKFTIPTTVYFSSSDNLADTDDIKILLRTIPSIVRIRNLTSFNHMEFMWGERARARIYNDIVSTIDCIKNG